MESEVRRSMTNRPPCRIGVLVPQGNVVHEREFAQLRPPQVQFRFAYFSYPGPGGEDFCKDLIHQFEQPVAELKAWRAELVLVGCTTASMSCFAEIPAQVEQMAEVPVVTAASASLEALAALRTTSVAVATPYGALNNQIVADFLESRRIHVAAIKGLGLDASIDTWSRAPHLTPHEVVDFSLKVDVAAAQTLYLPCTGLGSLAALELFERVRQKPAVSSVQAGFWASLRRLGIDGRQAGCGRLIFDWDY